MPKKFWTESIAEPGHIIRQITTNPDDTVKVVRGISVLTKYHFRLSDAREEHMYAENETPCFIVDIRGLSKPDVSLIKKRVNTELARWVKNKVKYISVFNPTFDFQGRFEINKTTGEYVSNNPDTFAWRIDVQTLDLREHLPSQHTVESPAIKEQVSESMPTWAKEMSALVKDDEGILTDLVGHMKSLMADMKDGVRYDEESITAFARGFATTMSENRSAKWQEQTERILDRIDEKIDGDD